LENGAYVNVKAKDGSTPLHWACANRYGGKDAVVSLLLEKGADPTITDDYGKTPLQIAQGNYKQNCVSAIEQFQQRQKQLNKQKQQEERQRLQSRLGRLLPWRHQQQQQEAGAKKKRDNDSSQQKQQDAAVKKEREELRQEREKEELERRRKEDEEVAKMKLQEAEQKQREKEQAAALKKQQEEELKRQQEKEELERRRQEELAKKERQVEQKRLETEKKKELAKKELREEEIRNRRHNKGNTTLPPQEVANVGTVENERRQPKAIINVYNGDAVPHMLALLQDIDSANVSLSMVKDIVEILGEDRQQFETLLIELKQVGFVTQVQGYEVELQKVLENQRTCDEDAHERKAIQESAVDYDFYLHLQWRLCSMIQASECIACGMVKKHESFREGLVTIVTNAGFLAALEQINFAKTLSAAVRTAMRQFDAVPGMHAARKAIEFIIQFCDGRNQKIAVARAAVFSALVEIRESPNGSLKSLVEKAARLLVRCNIYRTMYSESGGKVQHAKGALLNVLGDVASSPAGQIGTRAAHELYRIVVQPPEGSLFKLACEDVTNTVPLDIALVATLLNLSEQEVSLLDRFCLGSNSANNMLMSINTPIGIARMPTTPSASKGNYHEMEGLLVTEKEYAALKLKQEEHDKMIQFLKSKMTKDSDEVDGFEIDAGGGLKQMLLPKKSDEELKVRNQDAYIEKRVDNLEVLIDLLKEKLDMTELSHDEILLILKKQDQERANIRTRKKKQKGKRGYA
jgi:hypothetical protein